jgi:hypothetical protein
MPNGRVKLEDIVTSTRRKPLLPKFIIDVLGVRKILD